MKTIAPLTSLETQTALTPQSRHPQTPARNRFKFGHAATLAVLAAFLIQFAAPSAQAAARTWTGGSGDWETGQTGGFTTGPWANGDNPTFNGLGGTVTVKSDISSAAIVFTTC